MYYNLCETKYIIKLKIMHVTPKKKPVIVSLSSEELKVAIYHTRFRARSQIIDKSMSLDLQRILLQSWVDVVMQMSSCWCHCLCLENHGKSGCAAFLQ